MKPLLLVLLSSIMACAAEKPIVDVYMIHKADSKADLPEAPEIVLEIANPTDKTFYISGLSIESPMFQVEALREKRWLRIPDIFCGAGASKRPLKPGSKMLVTVVFPWEETAARFRFFFFTSPNQDDAKVISVWSRSIERKELGDLFGTTGELTSNVQLEDVVPDGETNKDQKASEGAANVIPK